MTIFDINVYWNVTSNTSVALSSTFKSFILILDFATFRLFEKFMIDICMRSQSVERFKQIIQQLFKKLNLEKFRIELSSNQFIKNWKKEEWIWWFQRCDCLFKMIVRADCLIAWRLFIMIKEQLLTERKTCVTKWILLFLCYCCCSYPTLVFYSKVLYIF